MRNLGCSDKTCWVRVVGSWEILLMVCHALWGLVMFQISRGDELLVSLFCHHVSFGFPRQMGSLSIASGMIGINCLFSFCETVYVVGSTLS